MFKIKVIYTTESPNLCHRSVPHGSFCFSVLLDVAMSYKHSNWEEKPGKVLIGII